MDREVHAITDLIIKFLTSGWDYQDISNFIWLLYSSQIIDINELTLICDTFVTMYDCDSIKKNNKKAYCVKE